MAEEDTLVTRRSKRSTAGNRMELALAELALEETQELEDDVEFVDDKDEEDIFESDFASTDEEAMQEDVEVGEKMLEDEERRERRVARARVEKATAAAHARQRVTFNPDAGLSTPKPRIQKPKRRVSLGVAVNAETGEVIEETTNVGSSGVTGKRQSKRRHTMMNTTATVTRMKDAEEKKAALPKKPKVVMRMPTQDELIARALDTEEGNILEHRNYLHLEEEKRARARVVRQSITGPVLRWISKKEHVKVPVPVPPAPAQSAPGMHMMPYTFMHAGVIPGRAQSSVGITTAGVPFVGYIPLSVLGTGNGQPPNGPSVVASMPPAPAQPRHPAAPTPSATPTPIPTFLTPPPAALSAIPNVMQPVVSVPPPPSQQTTIDVCKNYVVHELGQNQTAKKPLWKDTMYAMFGDHVPWEELRVYTGKNRPLSRPTRMCPITGLPARYLDPRTNVPFASVAGFQTLTKILSHEYVWCEPLGCYVTPGNVVGSGQEEGGEVGRAVKKQRIGMEGG